MGSDMHEQQERPSRHIATTAISALIAGRSKPENQYYLSEHKPISDERNNSGFTLADIARETSLHDHSVWGERSNLRNKPVHFVDSGLSELFKSNLSDEADINIVNAVTTDHADRRGFITEESDQPQKSPVFKDASNNSDRPRAVKILTPSVRMQTTGPAIDKMTCNSEVFVIDEIEKKVTGKSGQTSSVQIPESHSSLDSSSGDELILFRGRRSHNGGMPHRNSLPTMTSRHSPHSTDDICFSITLQNPKSKDKIPRRQKTERNRGRIDKEEDILLDYISNIQENGELGDTNEQDRHTEHTFGGSEEELLFGPNMSDNETHGGLYVSNKDSRHHLRENSSISDLHQTDRYEMNKNDDLDNISDEQGGRATFVARSMSGPRSSLYNMDAFAGLNVLDTNKGRDKLCREQVGFDHMDWNRPGVQRVERGKGALGQHFSFDNCDSDLELRLRMAWENDRLRKKERKKEREEIRASGMLRKKVILDDLRFKYPFGLTITEVADELRSFLQHKKEMYALPENTMQRSYAIES